MLIRGLTFVRTEFNGRDSFSADGYRGLNFNDISPELMAGVDAYKNQTAEMIEGGIAGTVDLRTRLPFDADGPGVSLTGRANYGDRSRRHDLRRLGHLQQRLGNGLGPLRRMVNTAYSHVKTQTEGVIMQRIGAFCNAATRRERHSHAWSMPTASSLHLDSLWRLRLAIHAEPGELLAGGLRSRAPRRIGALQFESSDKNVRRRFSTWTRITTMHGWSAARTSASACGRRPAIRRRAAPFAPRRRDAGVSASAPTACWSPACSRSRRCAGWMGTQQRTSIAAPPFPACRSSNYCGDLAAAPVPRRARSSSNEARNFDHSEGTRDLSLNVRGISPTDCTRSFDVQHIKAKTNNYDILVATRTHGGRAVRTEQRWHAADQAAAGLERQLRRGLPRQSAQLLHSVHPGSLRRQRRGRETAARADLEYDLGERRLARLVEGRRALCRSRAESALLDLQLVAGAPPWNCNGPGFNIDNTTPAPIRRPAAIAGAVQGYGAGIWESTTLGDFYNGNVFPNGPMVYLQSRDAGGSRPHIEALRTQRRTRRWRGTRCASARRTSKDASSTRNSRRAARRARRPT